MKSHKLLPKAILKQFADEKQSLHCYDVGTNSYCKRRPDSLFVEENHYSHFVENELSKEIEAPLGKTLATIKEHFGGQKVELSNGKVVIKKYLFSLIVRSKEMKDAIGVALRDKNNSYTQQEINDMSVIDGLEEVEKDSFWEDYDICLLECEGIVEFVLPLRGFCEFLYRDQRTIIVPLTPRIAACVFDKKAFKQCLIAQEDNFVTPVNAFAFQQQKEMGYGCVMASNEKTIKDLIMAFQEE